MTWEPHATPWTVEDINNTAVVTDATGEVIAQCYRGPHEARRISALPEALNALHEVGDIVEAQLAHGEVDEDGWKLALEHILAPLEKAGELAPPDLEARADIKRKTLAAKTHTLELEAAMCVWECLNDWTTGAHTELHGHLCEIRRFIGTAELRHMSIPLARYCLDVYDLIPEEARDGVAYDWDIIPTILGTVDWSRDDGVPLPVDEAAAIATRELLKQQSPPPTAPHTPPVEPQTVEEGDYEDNNTVRNEWGLACQRCGSDGHLHINAVVAVELSVDGSEPVDGTHEWDDDSTVRCAGCDWTGTVGQCRAYDLPPAPIANAVTPHTS